MFGDAPKHVKCFACSLISIAMVGIFAIQGEELATDPELLKISITLFGLSTIVFFGLGIIFLLFDSGGLSRSRRSYSNDSQNGGFWKALAFISGIAGIITIVSVVKGC
ncbi:MAG: hypothetical protein V3V99_11240 [candidate division Zixibacteria bacterium]